MAKAKTLIDLCGYDAKMRDVANDMSGAATMANFAKVQAGARSRNLAASGPRHKLMNGFMTGMFSASASRTSVPAPVTARANVVSRNIAFALSPR